MPRSVVVWGAGGHGKVVADLVRACGRDVAAFVDGDPSKVDPRQRTGEGPPVLAEQDFLDRIGVGQRISVGTDVVALGVGDNKPRQEVLARLGVYRLPSFIHPSATVSPSAVLSRGSIALAASVVNAGASIGRAVIVNSGAVVEHDCVIADCVHVSPGAVLAGGVRVGERTWIGAGATVIQGIRIGADVTVGAGAVVIRDVSDGAVVVGVPARPIGPRTGAIGLPAGPAGDG